MSTTTETATVIPSKKELIVSRNPIPTTPELDYESFANNVREVTPGEVYDFDIDLDSDRNLIVLTLYRYDMEKDVLYFRRKRDSRSEFSEDVTEAKEYSTKQAAAAAGFFLERDLRVFLREGKLG